MLLGDRTSVDEDTSACVAIGPTGTLLSNVYVTASEIDQYVDVYVSNATRCKPPKADYKPKPAEYAACRSHLNADIAELVRHYGLENVAVVAMGAGCAKAFKFSSLEDTFSHQGQQQDYGNGNTIATFWTDNPAVLLPQNAPSRVSVVSDHLSLVLEWCRTGRLPELETPPAFECLDHFDASTAEGLLSLDIESYGALDDMPKQRVFNAIRAIITDQCPKDHLVETVAVCWRGGGELKASAWNLRDNDQLVRFLSFMSSVPKEQRLLGMNFQFDLGFLMTDTKTKDIPWTQWVVQDLSVTNYLQSEMRPERSLKNISPLLGTADYTEEVSLKIGKRYKPEDIDKLLAYNVKDAFSTLRNNEKLEKRIIEDYGPFTSKLSEYTINWYNELIWFAVHEGLNGVAIDEQAIRALDAKSERIVNNLITYGKRAFNAVYGGTGSNTYKEKLAVDALTAANLLKDKRIKRTGVKKRISRANENLELATGNLPKNHHLSLQIRFLQAYTMWSGMRSRYTLPMLVGRKMRQEKKEKVPKVPKPKLPRLKKGEKREKPIKVPAVKSVPQLSPASLILEGMVYPTWYLIPGQFEDNSKGGTKQGRIVCRNPGLQNPAKPVKRCLTSRFPGGFLLEADESQVELRTAALISGDPLMVADYTRVGGDRHLTTAKVVLTQILEHMKQVNKSFLFNTQRSWIEEILNDTTVNKDTVGINIWRQLGKTLNFLILFLGGARKAQETAQRELGVLLPLPVWQGIIDLFYSQHNVFAAWQQNWVNTVIDAGYVELPLIGQSRMFLGGKPALKKCINEIANFPIQTTAANALIDAHMKLRREIMEQGLRTVVPLTVYDAAYPDCPPDEVDHMKSRVRWHLENSDYWNRLQVHYGNVVPLKCDVKVFSHRKIAA